MEVDFVVIFVLWLILQGWYFLLNIEAILSRVENEVWVLNL